MQEMPSGDGLPADLIPATGAVPTVVPDGTTYTVAADSQGVAALGIKNTGTIKLDGTLVLLR